LSVSGSVGSLHIPVDVVGVIVGNVVCERKREREEGREKDKERDREKERKTKRDKDRGEREGKRDKERRERRRVIGSSAGWSWEPPESRLSPKQCRRSRDTSLVAPLPCH